MLYIFFADGFEEVEGLATLDVIRRAGIDILSVGIGKKLITGSHKIKVECDITDNEATFSGLDGIILPGGMPGTMNLLENINVDKSIDFCVSTEKLISAICAAPLILGRKDVLCGKRATCFPGFEKELRGAVVSDEYVVTDDNIITGKGMGSAINFGLEIVSYFKGRTFSDKLKDSLQCS